MEQGERSASRMWINPKTYRRGVTDKAVPWLALSLASYALLAGWRSPFLRFPLAALPLLVGLFILVGGLNHIRLPRWWTCWFVVLMAMLAWSLFVDLVNGSLEVNMGRYEAFVFVVIFVVCCAICVRSEGQIRVLLFAAVCATALSALVAVLQLSPYREPFLALWRWRYMSHAPQEAVPRLEELYGFILNGRAAGMTPYSLTLAHQIIAVLPLAIALFVTERRSVRRTLSGLCVVALLFGALATGARIAIVIGMISIVVTLLWIRKPARRVMKVHRLRAITVLLVVILGVFALVLFFDLLAFYKPRLLTPGEILRLKTWRSTVVLILEQPQVLLVGLGGGQFSEWGKRVGVLGSTHNQFLGALVEYGFFGLLLLLHFYWKTLRIVCRFKTMQSGRCESQGRVGLLYQRCCAISLLAYIAASLFHDQGPLTADVFHLMLVSIFVTLPRCY